MVLFQNSLITLKYNPVTDIVEIDYPDLHDYLLPEIKHSIDALVESVRNYDVKKLLLDSSQTIVSVREEESREVALYLAQGLVQTRVQPLSAVIETRAQENVQHVQKVWSLPFQLRHFTVKADALTWLMSGE
jgi:hypothetical protein